MLRRRSAVVLARTTVFWSWTAVRNFIMGLLGEQITSRTLSYAQSFVQKTGAMFVLYGKADYLIITGVRIKSDSEPTTWTPKTRYQSTLTFAHHIWLSLPGHFTGRPAGWVKGSCRNLTGRVGSGRAGCVGLGRVRRFENSHGPGRATFTRDF